MGSNIYDAPFYKPPKVATPFPGSVVMGRIGLFKNADWSSESVTIDTNNFQYPEGWAFSFSGTNLQDATTWIAFCLPPGTVCTLFDNVVKNPPENPYDFSGLGICVDLIGNGATQTVDLQAYGASGTLSAGIWRQVTLSEGWFQLFRDAGCQGPFNTIFLDEWPTGKANSLSGWWIDKQASSINYPCLTPPQQLVLSANSDGTGQSVTVGAANAFGSFTKPATADFASSKMNGKIQSFTCAVIPPVQAIIEQATVPYSVTIPAEGQTFLETVSGINAGSQPVQISLPVAQSQSLTISQTTTLQYSMSVTVSTTVSVTDGLPGDTTTGSITTSFTATVSDTTTKTTSKTQTLQLGATPTFSAPPQTNYSATASISFGDLPPTPVTTTGQFYYTQNLPGSILDPSSGYYMLTSPVIVNVTGAVSTQVSIDVTETPLSPG